MFFAGHSFRGRTPANNAPAGGRDPLSPFRRVKVKLRAAWRGIRVLQLAMILKNDLCVGM
jgi:hypothetical protein